MLPVGVGLADGEADGWRVVRNAAQMTVADAWAALDEAAQR